MFTRTTVSSCDFETSAQAQRFICDSNMRFREHRVYLKVHRKSKHEIEWTMQ